MNGAIIAVGSELLRFGFDDGNGDWLHAQLEGLGIEVGLRSRVADDVSRITPLVQSAFQTHEVVALTGGLGPTEDDRTREALAAAFALPLERDPDRLRGLEERLAARGLALSPAQARQADCPRGWHSLDNALGTAPGLLLTRADRLLFALPGVPAEMKAMFRAPRLAALLERGRAGLARRSLRIAGLPESAVDERLRDLYTGPGIDVTLLGGAEGIEVHLRARASRRDDAELRLDVLEHSVRERLGTRVVGRGDETLAVVVGQLLARAGKSLATAESCTAGMLGAAITAVSGSSAWYRGGFVTYSNELKCSLGGVRAETLEAHGAVSEAVARELARTARNRCDADFGLGITGIAGPGGGTPSKPVGRVHLALQDGPESLHWQHDFGGDRDTVRRRAVATALDRLRCCLLGAA